MSKTDDEADDVLWQALLEARSMSPEAAVAQMESLSAEKAQPMSKDAALEEKLIEMVGPERARAMSRPVLEERLRHEQRLHELSEKAKLLTAEPDGEM